MAIGHILGSGRVLEDSSSDCWHASCWACYRCAFGCVCKQSVKMSITVGHRRLLLSRKVWKKD